jgi:uncharacterized protein YjiS (DUF1127 family)
MSALEPALHAKSAAPRLTAIALRVAGFVRGFARTLVNRRHARELMELSDRQLADIGLTRTDLAAVRRLPIGQDPTASLADMAHRRSMNGDFVRLNR